MRWHSLRRSSFSPSAVPGHQALLAATPMVHSKATQPRSSFQNQPNKQQDFRGQGEGESREGDLSVWVCVLCGHGPCDNRAGTARTRSLSWSPCLPSLLAGVDRLRPCFSRSLVRDPPTPHPREPSPSSSCCLGRSQPPHPGAMAVTGSRAHWTLPATGSWQWTGRLCPCPNRRSVQRDGAGGHLAEGPPAKGQAGARDSPTARRGQCVRA